MIIDEHKKKPHSGWHHSSESKAKIRAALSGIPKTMEHRAKISASNMGRISPRKGKHLSVEHRQKIVLSNHNRIPPKGWHHTEELKQRFSLLHKGKKYHDSKPLSDEAKLRISIKNRAYRATEKGRQEIILAGIESHKHLKTVSKPQKELFMLLTQLFPDAQLEYFIKTKVSWRFADIAIPSLKIDFEFDGKHWHEPKIANDMKRDKELAEVGWLTFRINKEQLNILSKQKIFLLKGLQQCAIRHVVNNKKLGESPCF